MEKVERLMPYCIALVALGVLMVSERRGGPQELRAVEPEENTRLDAIRRALAFAQDSAVHASERAMEIERGPLSLGELQSALSFALQVQISERERATRLDKSSGPGDREQARDAFARIADWQKIEQTLRAMYVTKVALLKEEFERCKVTGKEYRGRAQLSQTAEQDLRTLFAAEIYAAKKAIGAEK